MNCSSQDDINFQHIFNFACANYIIILICTFAGFLIATFYLLIAPKQYEAIAQIKMAQIAIVQSTGNLSLNSNLNPLGTNLEDPATLVSRLKIPTTYDDEVINLCGHGLGNERPQIASMIKATLPKGVANIIEVSYVGSSPENALNCVISLFNFIKNSQQKLMDPYINEAKEKLLRNEIQLRNAKEFLSKDGLSTASTSYLTTRDEIRYLLDEKTSLSNLIITNKSRQAQLIAPVYVDKNPVAPRKKLSLLIGVLGGLALGFIIAFTRKLKRHEAKLFEF